MSCGGPGVCNPWHVDRLEFVPIMFRMDAAFRERVRLTIATALAVAPRAVKRAFADRHDAGQQDASRTLSQAAADALLRAYEVTDKPLPPPGPGVPARPEG